MDELKTVTIEGVELAATGWWEFSSGPRYLTQEHLEAAVAAQEDPSIRTPKIKIGHTDPRFGGQPLFGSVVNVRLSDNKQKLLGDYVIAASLAPLVAKSPEQDGEVPYAKRSIEGMFDYKSATGTEHAFVLTAVALLGEQDPAIEDLDDIVGIFTDEDHFVAAASATEPESAQRMLLAGAVVDRIRMELWQEMPADEMPWGDWSWVRRVEVDSGSNGFLVVEDDDTAKLYRVPWSIAGDDVRYGDAEEVVEQFVSAAQAEKKSIAFSRESNRLTPNPVTLAATQQKPPVESDVDLAKLRTKLGLPDDADEAAVEAKLDEVAKAQPQPEPEPQPKPQAEHQPAEPVAANKLPEGVVAIDRAQLDELKAQAKAGADAREEQRKEKRDALMAQAVKDGKFPPGRKQHYSDLYDKDPEGTREFIDKLAAGLVPLEERGNADNPDIDMSDEKIYNELFGEEVG